MRRIINKFYSKPGNIFVIIILQIYLIPGCTEQSTDPDQDSNNFSFNVKVVDDINKPMAGIGVGSYFHTSDLFLPKDRSILNINNPLASGNIRFTLEQECIVNLIVFNLENVKVQTLISDNKKAAGNYEIAWNAAGLKGSVYKIALIASDSTKQNILFTDSIYATLFFLGVEGNTMGTTDSNGCFNTTDKVYFPNLYTLPDLIRTAEASPTPLGIFSITDQITIELTDTLLNITKIFNKTIAKGKNPFVLKFSEGTNAIYKIVEINSIPRKVEVQSIIPKVKVNWSLEQNYPNPFN